MESWGSAVIIVTVLTGWVNEEFRFISQQRFFSLLPQPGWFWGSQSLLSNGYQRFFSPGAKVPRA
jgi:hypothetical protein